MILSQRANLAAAVLLTASTLSFATTPAKKHPAPKHEKAEHPAPQKGTKHKAPTATHHSAHPATHHSAKKVKTHKRGQAAIDNQRAGEIQQALVREHYMSGEPTGTWDTSTQEAMRRYQADQGWQTKEVPDSRALIKLGLGPDHDHLLNPESAMTTGPVSQTASNAHPAMSSHVSLPASSVNSTPVVAPATELPSLSSSR